MANSGDHATRVTVEPTWAAPSAPDVGRKTPPTEVDVAAVIRRKKREGILKKFTIGLRWAGFLFSFLAFVLMVSNRHGKGINFEDYEEYSYLLSIAIISSLYTACQGIRQVVQLLNERYGFHHPALAIFDFVADQILAYLLISAASVGIPITKDGREVLNDMKNSKDSTGGSSDSPIVDYPTSFNASSGVDNSSPGFSKMGKFLDAGAAAVSMTFLAFVVLAISAIISGHKLSSRFSS